MRLFFYGGAGGSVTGANYMIECGGVKILIDCGLKQGGRLAEKENYRSFSYHPKEISAVLITHAHLDHVGLIPKLYRDGFRGQIFAVHPTLDLARLNLDDSVHLLKEEAEKNKASPLFSEQDLIDCWKLTHGRAYHQDIAISSNIKIRFND